MAPFSGTATPRGGKEIFAHCPQPPMLQAVSLLDFWIIPTLIGSSFSCRSRQLFLGLEGSLWLPMTPLAQLQTPLPYSTHFIRLLCCILPPVAVSSQPEHLLFCPPPQPLLFPRQLLPSTSFLISGPGSPQSNDLLSNFRILPKQSKNLPAPFGEPILLAGIYTRCSSKNSVPSVTQPREGVVKNSQG